MQEINIAENPAACKRCGWCCTHLKLKIGEAFRGVDRAWLETRGIDIKAGYLIIPSECPHLIKWVSPDGVEGGSCDMYDSRPIICRVSRCPK